MPLSLQSRRVGDITVITCTGRIVEGAESSALQKQIEDLLPFGPYLVLDVGAIDFLDSSGLGLLVRYAARTRNANGGMKLCAPTAKMTAVLKATHLDRVFEFHATEADAIAAFYAGSPGAGGPSRLATDVLCVIASMDTQAYVREILSHAGYGVLAAANMPDALVLMQATRPKIVVIDAALRQAHGTQAADRFNRLADSLAVIELPAGFSHLDAGEAGRTVLEQVRAVSVP